MHARRHFKSILLAGLFACAVSGAAVTLPAQQPAPSNLLPDVAMPPKEQQPVNKLYIVGYALAILMTGLGVLVICHYRERKDRPDLPQEIVEERLRQGIKAPGQKAN